MIRTRIIRPMAAVALLTALAACDAGADTFTVTTTADTLEGSLRWAVLQAETHGGADTILFDIPETDPGYNAAGGVWTIRPQTCFGMGNDGTLIDGTSQTLARGDTNPFGPEIELDGSAAGYSSGFFFMGDDMQVMGLVINRFERFAIEAQISRRPVVRGCYLGTDPTGMTALGNALGGVSLVNGCTGARIGGASASEGNLIAGATTSTNIHTGNGISLDRCDSAIILGNLIGVNRDASDTLRNEQMGICIKAGRGNIVGGTDPGEGNVIGGSGLAGVIVREAAGSSVEGNAIGTDLSGTRNLGNLNYGMLLDYGAHDNMIGPGNRIAFSGNVGIRMRHDSTVANTITRNAITANGSFGIELIWGANAELDPPLILTATSSAVLGTAEPNSTVEIFSDSSDEGALYEGTVTADGAGNFLWNGSATGPSVTATCTDASGNTSPFSASLTLTGVEEPPGTVLPQSYALRANYPNPFNPSTTIEYTLPRAGHATLRVYTVLGEEVATLIDGEHAAGMFKATWDASGMPSGIYFYRLSAGDFLQTRKMTLIR